MFAGPEEIAAAVARLREGGLVAFPTETVYGLGADALNEQAVRRVFEVKGRPSNNPLIVHVTGPAMARAVVADWPREAQLLADKFWPGPLSIVLPKRDGVPDIVTAGGSNVALRCPDHPTTLALLEAFGGPLVGPSANPSGRVSPTTAAHVRESFTQEQVLVLDGGPCRGGIESTVVKIAKEVSVLRRGLISADAIGAALQRPVLLSASAADEPLESPGQLASHYAPVTRTLLCERGDLNHLLSDARRGVVLASSALQIPAPHALVTMPTDAAAYAAELYSALRGADASGADLIVVVRPAVAGSAEECSVWAAVLDRLERATAPK